MIEQLIYALLLLAVLGVVLYLVETYIPMPPPIKVVFRVIVVIVAILCLLSWFGLFHLPARVR